MLRVSVLILSLSLVTACGTRVSSSVPESPPETEQGASLPEANEILSLINQARASKQTCGSTSYPATTPLSLNSMLEKAAQKHSEDMQTVSKMSHDTKEGAIHYQKGMEVWDRVTQEGYNWKTVGENVAFGFANAENVMNAWLNSEGHCKNIMNPNFKELGVGKAGSYWTQVFATSK